MKLCAKNGWKYIFTQKDTRQKQVGEAYEWIKEGNGATDVRYSDADISCMESACQRNKTEHKKYIFNVTGKFSKTNSKG